MKFLLIISAIALAAPPTAMAQTGKWSCVAKGIKDFNYDGGERAMILIKPFTSPGRYKVTKVSETEVKGKTGNGTPFTCTRS